MKASEGLVQHWTLVLLKADGDRFEVAVGMLG